MKIKVCGMREDANIKGVADLRPDFMGFIFYRRSPRYFGEDREGMLIRMVAERGIEPVGVTVDEGEESILNLSEKYGLRTFQLHGGESPELCASLRERGFKVIKAIGIGGERGVETLGRYAGAVDMFLLDTACAEKGGSGVKFDWRVLESYEAEEPFLLSGGIGPDDYEVIKGIRHRRFAGIDLNSRFETAPGLKDREKLESFMNRLRGQEGMSKGNVNY